MKEAMERKKNKAMKSAYKKNSSGKMDKVVAKSKKKAKY